MDSKDWHWPTVWSNLERLLDLETEQRRAAAALGLDDAAEEREAVAARRAIRSLMARGKMDAVAETAIG